VEIATVVDVGEKSKKAQKENNKKAKEDSNQQEQP
jgi:hypothetical protein